MTEVAQSKEVVTGSVADKHLSQRKQVLNERLKKWAMWMVGGTAVGIAGTLMIPAVPFVGWPLAVGGSVAEAGGWVGIVGNLAKRVRKKNR